MKLTIYIKNSIHSSTDLHDTQIITIIHANNMTEVIYQYDDNSNLLTDQIHKTARSDQHAHRISQLYTVKQHKLIMLLIL